jgi:RTX calcium-binding nonapeptide repeat (4 copies)
VLTRSLRPALTPGGRFWRSGVIAAFALILFPQTAGGELNPLDISPAGASASAPRVASDGAGNVVAVWREVDGDTDSISAAVRPAGGAWSSAQRISSPALAAESPELAMDRQGNSVAVWQRSTGRNSVVQAAVRPAGGTWSSPQDLSSAGVVAFEPDVSAEAGRATVVWTAVHASRTVVESSTRSTVGAWSVPKLLSDPGSNATAPVVSMDDRGGAAAAWQWFDGAHLAVAAAVLPGDGQWSSPELLSAAGRDALRPRVAMDAAGNAAVAWVRSNGSWNAAQVSNRLTGGSWQPPSNLSIRSGNAAALDLVMNRRGDAIVSWKQSRGDGSSADLWSSLRPAGSTRWAARVAITESWQGLRAQVALDEAGNATAVWAGSATVSASFKPAGEAWQENYLLSNFEFSAVLPAVTAHAPRNATAVWIRVADEDDRVQAVSYDVNTSTEENADEGEDESEGDEGEVFKGTVGADTLVGTRGNDIFFGYDGNDRIFGRGGRDVVYGGPGNDRIFGGRDSDRLFGGAGRDRLVGGNGNDVLVGDWGRDLLRGETGNDTLIARDGRADKAFGGSGLDRYRLDRWLDLARSIESRL